MHVNGDNDQYNRTGSNGYNTNRGEDRGSIAYRTRMVATLGVMAAISVILLVLGTLISINTVFFTALASFLVGIAVVKYKFGAGLMLFLGCALLDFLLNPNKFHVFLYLAMAGFILLAEGSYILLEKRIQDPKKRSGIHLIFRIVVFAAVYIPLVIWVPYLFLSEQAMEWMLQFSEYTVMMIGVGIIGFLLFDIAYIFVKRTYINMFKF